MFMLYCDVCESYSLQKKCTKCDSFTRSAHPARFSPDDKFSKQRLIAKSRLGLLPTSS
ncbi:hypothetical protein P9112_014315 [Eukaryota sp. TZLM1-RC]